MKCSVVIPARLGSTRLPRKVLADLGGKPVLWHTWNQVMAMDKLDEVVVATDDAEILEVAQAWGAKVVMTDPACTCGTERIASILDTLQGDLILNVQADEVFINPKLLDALVEEGSLGKADIVTPVFQIERTEELFNPNLVKAVLNKQGQALYFSRSTVPHVRGEAPESWISQHCFYGHVGVYAYQRKVLKDYAKLPSSVLESMERLEQLRFLESGYRIQTIPTDYHSIAIDTQQDLEQASRLITPSVVS